jgi:hypothetical protein
MGDSAKFGDTGWKSDFRADLTALLNKYNMENGSDTPDIFLAEYLCLCLAAYDTTTRMREGFLGVIKDSTERSKQWR